MQTLKAKWGLFPVKINKPAPSAKDWLSAYFWSDPDGIMSVSLENSSVNKLTKTPDAKVN